MSTILPYDGTKRKYDVYRDEDYIKKFFKSLKEHAIEIINFIKKEMVQLTNEQQKSYKKAKVCYTCRKKFKDKFADNKKYRKVRDHCHYTGEYRGVSRSASHSICNLKYSIPK